MNINSAYIDAWHVQVEKRRNALLKSCPSLSSSIRSDAKSIKGFANLFKTGGKIEVLAERSRQLSGDAQNLIPEPIWTMLHEPS